MKGTRHSEEQIIAHPAASLIAFCFGHLTASRGKVCLRRSSTCSGLRPAVSATDRTLRAYASESKTCLRLQASLTTPDNVNRRLAARRGT